MHTPASDIDDVVRVTYSCLSLVSVSFERLVRAGAPTMAPIPRKRPSRALEAAPSAAPPSSKRIAVPPLPDIVRYKVT